MQDIADFLRTHAPFDTLDEEVLADVARSAEIEFHAVRATILDARAGRLSTRMSSGPAPSSW